MEPNRRPRPAVRPRFAIRSVAFGRSVLHLLPCPAGIITDALEGIGLDTVSLPDGSMLPAALVGAIDGDLLFRAEREGQPPIEVELQDRHARVRAEPSVAFEILRCWLEFVLRAAHPDVPDDRLLRSLEWPPAGSGWHEPVLQTEPTGRGRLILRPLPRAELREPSQGAPCRW